MATTFHANLAEIANKELLTIPEAMALTGIGRDTLRRIVNENEAELALWVGQNRSKILIKRQKLVDFLLDVSRI